jgi:hypothetical protein
MLQALQLLTNLANYDSPRFVAVYADTVVRGKITHAVGPSGRGWRAELDGRGFNSVVSPTMRQAVAHVCAQAFHAPVDRADVQLRAALSDADILSTLSPDDPYWSERADIDGHATVGGVERRSSADHVFRSRSVVTVVNPGDFKPGEFDWWRTNAPRWNSLSDALLALVERFDARDETHLAYSSWYRPESCGFSIATFAVAPTVRGQRIAVYPPARDCGARYHFEGYAAPAAIIGATTWQGADGGGDDSE